MKALLTLASFATLVTLAGCAHPRETIEGFESVTPAAVPELPQAADPTLPADRVAKGRYLAGLLGCGNCHTDGALIGAPDAERALAGSSVGIAWSNPLEKRNPGVVFPSNLTPDPETGLGNWSVEEIVTLMQSGINAHGGSTVPVMPWLAYSKLSHEDAAALAMYLKSLPPVENQVPDNVEPGRHTRHPYVHFGVYRSRRQAN